MQLWATYLGYMLGLEGRNLTWRKALATFEMGIARWSSLQLGLQDTIAAYSVYVASVLSFLLQLEPRPADWKTLKKRRWPSLSRAFRWVLLSDLHQTREPGTSQNIRDLSEVQPAAKFHMLKFDAFSAGGLQVRRRLSSLTLAIQETSFLCRYTI